MFFSNRISHPRRWPAAECRRSYGSGTWLGASELGAPSQLSGSEDHGGSADSRALCYEDDPSVRSVRALAIAVYGIGGTMSGPVVFSIYTV